MLDILAAVGIGVLTSALTELSYPPKGAVSRDRAKSAAVRVGKLMGWKHFDCFVERLGFTESRHNPRAMFGGWKPGAYWSNTARGQFGFRPETATAGAYPGGRLMLSGPPEVQVALVADYVHRLITKHDARDWLDARAGWAYSHLANKSAETHERRAQTERNWWKADAASDPCKGVHTEQLARTEWPGGPAVLAAALGKG